VEQPPGRPVATVASWGVVGADGDDGTAFRRLLHHGGRRRD
jgi:hypothetical protein